jgi:hypothetical protein
VAQLSDQLRYTVSPGQGWYSFSPALPGSTPDFHGLIDRLQLTGAPADRMLLAASAAWRFAEHNFDEWSERWILIRDPEAARVDAVLSLDLHAAPDPNGADLYQRLAQEGAEGGGEFEVINRTCERLELDTGVAIIVHDFALPEPDEDLVDPVTERAVVGLFVAEVPVLAEFSLVTQDLGLTDEIVSDLLQVVRSFRIGQAS